MLDMSQTAGAMRLGLAVAVAGAVCFFSSAVEGLAVGYGHACVVLDNGSVKVRGWQAGACCVVGCVGWNPLAVRFQCARTAG